MGIDLPPELTEAAAEAGLNWPQLDEDLICEQAVLWRTAYEELVALGEEAKEIANAAVKDLPEKARHEMVRSWQAFIDPELGRLSVAMEGARQAAERLERAANLVGESKVELVRELISLAKLRDIASITATMTSAVVDQHSAAEEWNRSFHEASTRLWRTVEKLTRNLAALQHSF